MRDRIVEKLEVPVVGRYDVIVAGGGIAGVAAALAARRAGMRVLIIEKSVMFGGLATLGLIAHYLPLCDGHGRKVIGGIAEELLKLSVKYGYGRVPEAWSSGTDPGEGAERYAVKYCGHTFALALDELIEAEGIDVVLDTVFCRPVMQRGRCQALVVENKSGRAAYRSEVVVDATGDADVMAGAGAEIVEGENRLSIWYYATSLERMAAGAGSGRLEDGVELAVHGKVLGSGGEESPEAGETEVYRGIGVEQVTAMVMAGRRLLRSQSPYMRADRSACVLTLPGMPQFRKTRRIRGTDEMKPGSAFEAQPSSVGCVCDWRAAGPVFEVPYGSLIAPGIANVLTAGRSVAAEGDMWELMRVIPPAALTGQAAGSAAAIAVENKTPVDRVPIAVLQERLVSDGVIVHWDR